MFPRTLSHIAQDTLALLGRSNILDESYLAGGSALALQFEHRRSIDFDFFSDKEIDTEKIKSKLQKIGTYVGEQQTPKTMVGVFNKVKFSHFYYPYKLIAATKKFSNIQIASFNDIAAMKLVAITDRGTKKDYIDLYFLVNKGLTFEAMFKLYDQKYKLLKTNLFTLIKSISYFDAAEGTEMPDMIVKTSWTEVKKFFQKEVIKLAKKYL